MIFSLSQQQQEQTRTMSSWFSGTVNTLSNLADKVQSSVHIDPDLLQKITLQTPDLVDERTKIDNEQRRKEQVRDSLAEILPWQTRDDEMEILVDECREVILGLSSNEETFTGPFVLSGGLAKENEEVEEDEDLKVARDVRQAEKAAEKLAKLQPLPALLSDFDLDTHVGLIQRLFEADPKLVEVHSKLSAGGQRELAFWKNYFFHCAYARYEAGLSIDEIWSNEANPPKRCNTEEEDGGFDVVDKVEEEISFVSGNEAKQSSIAEAASQQSLPNTAVKNVAESLNVDLDDLNNSTEDTSGGTSYEFVPPVNKDDEEMDELEAEIAAALVD